MKTLMKTLISLLLLASLAYGQQYPTYAIAGMGPNGFYANFGLDNSGNLITTGGTHLFQIGGYVGTVAAVAQTPSGGWGYLNLDALGNLKTTGSSSSDPDTPPTSPLTMSDEFNTGTSIDLSKWTWLNQNSGTDNITDGYLVTTLGGVAGDLVQGFTQLTPASPYAFEMKCSQPPVIVNSVVTACGLGLYETVSTKGTYFWFENPIESVNIPSVDAQQWTANTFGSAVTPLTHSFVSYEYLKVLNDGTNIIYSASVDGRSWTTMGGKAISGLFTTTPNEVCICFLNNGVGGFANSFGVDFFRELTVSSISGTDTFTGSSDLNNYTSQPVALPNGWSITANTLTNSLGSGQAVLYASSVSTFGDGTVSAKVKFASTASGPYAGVSARVNTSTGVRYGALLVPGSNQIQLFRFAQWSPAGATEIGSASWTADTNQHTVLLTVLGPMLTVYLDGTLAISATDGGVGGLGSVGIESFNGNASYQQFQYSSTSAVTQ
jgi:hypothetical protein